MAPRTDIDWQDATYEAAAEWVVRLHAPVSASQAEADWIAFEAWLGAAPDNRAAFDAAQALWNEVGVQARPIRRGLAGQTASILSLNPRRRAPGPLGWTTAAAAAAAVLLIAGPFSPFRAAAPSVYSTVKGERRSVTLADGSQIDLNGGSQISVLIGRHVREVDLAEGSEAAFSIVHDASRPFLVHVGDRTVRDVGTQFDVLRNAGSLTVTVRAGMVEVSPASSAAGDTVALSPGQQLNHREGAVLSNVAEVNADDAFGWRSGRLIYRDKTLAEVAADLSRYYAEPVRAQGAAGALRFSGVLEIAGESSVIDRLSALVPVSANAKDGVIVLTERTVSR
jgi:transmembrane sensor